MNGMHFIAVHNYKLSCRKDIFFIAEIKIYLSLPQGKYFNTAMLMRLTYIFFRLHLRNGIA